MEKCWVTNWNDGRKTHFLTSRREKGKKVRTYILPEIQAFLHPRAGEGWGTHLGAGLGSDAVGVLRRPETTTGALLGEPPPAPPKPPRGGE